MSNINDVLSIPPQKHTFIFIKEMLRCAKTINKRYVGILYERFSKHIDDAAIIQGLVGRDTGYDNNGVSITYTNIDSIVRYEKLWESNFDDPTIKWSSKTTRYKNGILSGKDTFNDPKNYDHFSSGSESDSDAQEPVIKVFKSQEECKEYFIQHLKARQGPTKRGPKKVKPNSSGFYEATIRSNRKVYRCDEIQTERKHGLNTTNYRVYPCYQNTDDPATLEWWFIHY